MFQGLPSWVQSVAHQTLFGENKIVRRFFSGSPIGCSQKERRASRLPLQFQFRQRKRLFS
jgi:hypothetical protein